ncbi:MAG TPA: M81 family metallopeptidase [Chthonomonadaceae bacterium]|nr:M81 family metallopeptidase [Chthonomonadaceae bacterium]
MRIAIGGIGHETNTFSTLMTGTKEFYVRRGEECIQDDFWHAYQEQGVELVPTLTAGAAPHGPVGKDAYLQLKTELLERLERALPVDGVFLSLHGAMEIQEIGDGEGDLVTAVRERIGPQVQICASLDLHGNISPAFVAAANILTALRTAPHRDGRETRERALSHLLRSLRESLHPVTAMVKLPLLLPGEYAVTEVEPARSLYGLLAEIERIPGILDASLMIGCAWTDSPHTSVSALVVAEEDEKLAYQEAVRLAETVWARRKEFGPDVETASVEEAISRALSYPEAPVFISDSGDNVTAGGAGDMPLFIERLLAAKTKDAVVAGLTDAAAVDQCAQAGVGAEVTMSLGGKLDRINARPLEVTGRVMHLDPLDAPNLAVVQVEGITILLINERWPFADLSSFQRAHMDPLKQKIVVVKLGYLFPELRDNAPRAILALSPGFTDLRLERLPYQRIRRPIYPLDLQVEWRAAGA